MYFCRVVWEDPQNGAIISLPQGCLMYIHVGGPWALHLCFGIGALTSACSKPCVREKPFDFLVVCWWTFLDMWQNDRAHHQQSKWMARISIEVRIRLDMLFSRGPTQQDDRYTISWWSQAASDTQSWCFFCSIFRDFDTLDLQLLQLSNHHLAKEHSPLDHVLISKAWRCLRLARLV